MKFSFLSLLYFILNYIIIRATSASPIIELLRSNLLFSVADYGTVGDGIHYDTSQIQAAIDDCSSHGGGRVIFPPGTYLTATIFLKSGVVLEVQKNATILGGTRLEDYPAENNRWYVVVAEEAENVGITGGGEINGQGLKFVKRFDEKKNVMISWNETGACLGDECRPRLVGFIRSKNVEIWNVNFTHPAYWCESPMSQCSQSSSLGRTGHNDEGICACGLKVKMLTSWTTKNPGRRFYCCSLLKVNGGCDYFQWKDDDYNGRAKVVISELSLKQKNLEEKVAAGNQRIEKLSMRIKKLKQEKKIQFGFMCTLIVILVAVIVIKPR